MVTSGRGALALMFLFCVAAAAVLSDEEPDLTPPRMLTKETVDWSSKYQDSSAHKPREPQTWTVQHQIEQGAREQRGTSSTSSGANTDPAVPAVDQAAEAPFPLDDLPQREISASEQMESNGNSDAANTHGTEAQEDPQPRTIAVQPEVALLAPKPAPVERASPPAAALAADDAAPQAAAAMGDASVDSKGDVVDYARDISFEELKAAMEAEEHEAVHHYQMEDQMVAEQVQDIFSDQLDTDFNIYIYDLPARFNKQSAEYHVGSRPMQDDIAGLEAQVYDLFTRRYSPIITTDISKARAYLVPVLAANMCVEQPGDERACIRSAFADAIEEVKSQGAWNNGHNHFFIAMWDLGICGSQCTYVGEQGDAKDCSDWIQQRGVTSRSLIEEAGQISFYNAVDKPACFRDDRDLVLPALKSFPEPAHRPDVATNKLYFRGLASSPVRLELAQEFRGVEGAKVLVNEPASAPQVAMEMAMSEFCLLPRGMVPWSYHLLEVARAGCIPVIPDADTLALPAHRSINWNKAAVLVNGHTKQAIEAAVWDKTGQDVRRYRAYSDALGRELGSWESDRMFATLMHEMSMSVRASTVSRSRAQQLLQPAADAGKSTNQLTVLHA